MTDRELLELAAKAAGISVNFHPTASYYWNPLANDGDALRLAVKLDLDIGIGEAGQDFGSSGHWNVIEHGEPYAATRRAIVRAAAEIGKARK